MNTVASTPNPAPAALVLTILRAALMIAGILGLTLPAALNDQNTLANLAGAISTVAGIVWQVVAEFQAANNDHNNTVASVSAGRAVKLVA